MTTFLTRLRRTGMLAGTAAALAVIVAALPWLRGDDSARSVLRARLTDREPDPAALDAVRAELDLPTNPIAGAADWLGRAVTGDLGRSWVDGTLVRDSLTSAAAVSAGLAAAACAVAVIVAVILLVPVAWRATNPQLGPSESLRVLSAGIAALPEFVLAVVLLTVVAIRWRLAPAAGWFGPSSMVLPALALGLPSGGLLARLVANSIEATTAEQWVRTWRTTGCGRPQLAIAIARRAMTVAVPQLAVLFVGLLGGAVAVEQLFAIPGVGRLALRAALAQDLPIVQGCVLLLLLTGAAAGVAGIAAHRLLLGPAGAVGAAGLNPQLPAHRANRHRVALAVGAAFAVVIVAGLLRDPDRVRLDQRLNSPSWTHPLGTDPVGRDVLAQFGHGALLTIGTASAVSAVAFVVGLVVGLRGSQARAGAADILNALPPVVVGLVVAAVLGPGLGAAATAAALVCWVPLAVHTRSLADEIRASGYHQAAVLSGAGSGWLLRRHLLPAVTGPVLVHTLVRVPGVALAIAVLSFLGLGAGHDTPEWGAQLAAALGYLERAPTAAAAPVLGLIVLGILAGSAPDRAGDIAGVRDSGMRER